MSTPATQARRADHHEAAHGTVALIAGDGPRQVLARVLDGGRRPVSSFDSLQAMLAWDGPTDPAAIVLWVEDTLSSPTGVVELTKRFRQTPVVIACKDIQRWEVRAALAAGAAGVVTDRNLPRTLGTCLRAVLAGQICVPREHWRQIEPPVLSTREKQILGLVVMGYMNSQIAARLFLAESTVKSHLSSAFGKLGVRSRNEAVDLILNPERGLGMGILALGGEPVQPDALSRPDAGFARGG